MTKNLMSLKPNTMQLIKAIYMDEWPGMATRVDFGLDGWAGSNPQMAYEALYYPLINGEITDVELDACIGSGPKLTELVNKCPHNPHKGIVFHTAWDEMEDDECDEEHTPCRYCRTGEGSSCDCV